MRLLGTDPVTTRSAVDASERKATSVIPGWLPAVLMVLFLAAVARQGVRAISDPDTFWHLRLGARHPRAPVPCRRSPSPGARCPSQPWVPTQWLTEVVLAVAEDLGGLPAVAWLFTVALLVLVLLIHRMARHVADAVPAAFATGLTDPRHVGEPVATTAPGHLPLSLPHPARLATAPSTTSGRAGGSIPFTWLWAMSHGMWFVGPLVGLAVVRGLFARSTSGSFELVIKLAAVPAAPPGRRRPDSRRPGPAQAPFAVAGIGAFITEWQPPSFRSARSCRRGAHGGRRRGLMVTLHPPRAVGRGRPPPARRGVDPPRHAHRRAGRAYRQPAGRRRAPGRAPARAAGRRRARESWTLRVISRSDRLRHGCSSSRRPPRSRQRALRARRGARCAPGRLGRLQRLQAGRLAAVAATRTSSRWSTG